LERTKRFRKTGSASITTKKDGDVTIKGKDVTIDAAGKMTAKEAGEMVARRLASASRELRDCCALSAHADDRRASGRSIRFFAQTAASRSSSDCWATRPNAQDRWMASPTDMATTPSHALAWNKSGREGEPSHHDDKGDDRVRGENGQALSACVERQDPIGRNDPIYLCAEGDPRLP